MNAAAAGEKDMAGEREPAFDAGLFRRAPPPVVVETAPTPAGLELDLLLANLMAALQRISTDPGTGDLKFIRGIRGRRVHTLTDDERMRLQTLRWRYRFRLPPGLRPSSPPG